MIAWDVPRHRPLAATCGERERDFAGTRGADLSRAILGDDEVGTFSTPAERADRACGHLINRLDAKIAKLVQRRAGLDHEAIALDRAEARRRRRAGSPARARHPRAGPTGGRSHHSRAGRGRNP